MAKLIRFDVRPQAHLGDPSNSVSGFESQWSNQNTETYRDPITGILSQRRLRTYELPQSFGRAEKKLATISPSPQRPILSTQDYKVVTTADGLPHGRLGDSMPPSPTRIHDKNSK